MTPDQGPTYIQDLFGSWAARYEGEEGPPPHDIDLLIIGRPDRDLFDDAAQRAGARLAREVDVVVRSPRWWTDGNDGFHRQIRSRPLARIGGEPA